MHVKIEFVIPAELHAAVHTNGRCARRDANKLKRRRGRVSSETSHSRKTPRVRQIMNEVRQCLRVHQPMFDCDSQGSLGNENVRPVKVRANSVYVTADLEEARSVAWFVLRQLAWR